MRRRRKIKKRRRMEQRKLYDQNKLEKEKEVSYEKGSEMVIVGSVVAIFTCGCAVTTTPSDLRACHVQAL